MTQIKRNRGRPKGTGKRDDATLRAVADLLVRNVGLTATAARRQVEPIPNEADIRRFQLKWSAAKVELLAAANARRERRRLTNERDPISPHTQREYVDAISSLRATIEGITANAGLRAIQNSPAMRAIRDLREGSAMRAIRGVQESPAITAALRKQTDITPNVTRLMVEHERAMRKALGMRLF